MKDVNKDRIENPGGLNKLGKNGYILVGIGKRGPVVGRARASNRCGESFCCTGVSTPHDGFDISYFGKVDLRFISACFHFIRKLDENSMGFGPFE